MSSFLKTHILPAEQQKLFGFLIEQEWLSDFYLAGGTSLALQIGHRESVDFDFFTSTELHIPFLKNTLASHGRYEQLSEMKGTLHLLLNDVRVSFIEYKYQLLEPLLKEKCLVVASLLDVALMKLEAIAGRGAKKDFIDLFFLLKKFTLNELLMAYEKKYGVTAHNHYHLMKSLTYFADAETERMPVMFEKITWEQVKQGIIVEVKKIRH